MEMIIFFLSLTRRFNVETRKMWGYLSLFSRCERDLPRRFQSVKAFSWTKAWIETKPEKWQLQKKLCVASCLSCNHTHIPATHSLCEQCKQQQQNKQIPWFREGFCFSLGFNTNTTFVRTVCVIYSTILGKPSTVCRHFNEPWSEAFGKLRKPLYAFIMSIM